MGDIPCGTHYYNNQINFARSKFRNMFPNTPLIGVYVSRPSGHNYLPNKNN